MSKVNVQMYEDAKKSIKTGIKILADAVGSTLGPKGRCAVILGGANNDKVRITKDGVSVAKAIDLPDNKENTGACLIREAALKTVNGVGDSTTTATVLAYSLIHEASIYDDGTNAIHIKNELEKSSKYVLDEIDKRTIPIKESDLATVATIAVNNDAELGNLIADTYKQVGEYGVVTVEESPTNKTYSQITIGEQFNQGYIANHFVTDKVKDQCVLEKPYIFITEHAIKSTRDLIGILDPIAKERRSILIIAQDFDDSVIENMKLNHLQGILKSCLVKAPSYGEYRREYLKDLAVATGSMVLTYDSGLEVCNVDMTMLGTCKKVVVTKDTTTIIEGCGIKEDIDQRVKQLKYQLDELQSRDDTKDSFTTKDLQGRLAKLASGIGVIYVGGTTELEMLEKRDRVEDAVCAVKTAMKGGIVRGGGVTLRDIAYHIELKTVGDRILSAALLAPYETLLSNAGMKYEVMDENQGINLVTGEKVKDMLDENIIDPALACKEAFINALSVATLYLSTSCLITDVPVVNIL